MTEKKGKASEKSKTFAQSKKSKFDKAALFVAIVTLIGIFVNLYVNYKNQELTKKISVKQDEVSKIQTVVDYIPYLSSDRKEQRTIAVVALSKILDPETAILMGIAAGGDAEINEAV